MSGASMTDRPARAEPTGRFSRLLLFAVLLVAAALRL
jgi:hypothetical protein